LVRLAALPAVGPLDERFFAYYEDAEWGVRAARAGWRSLHVPAARIGHAIDPAARADSAQVHYYMTRNRLLFLAATGAGPQAWLRTLAGDYARTLASWSLRRRWRHRRAARAAMLRGVADYWRGRFGAAPGGA
jgi:GT2 family glycosyltransferase